MAQTQTKGPLTIDTIVCLLTWLCRKLTKDEIIIAIAILQDVVNDKRDDIRPRNDFQENHPHYRQFTVDPKSPLIEAPLLKAPEAVADYRLLLLEYRRKTGKELKAVRRHKDSHHPPPGVNTARLQLNFSTSMMEKRQRNFGVKFARGSFHPIAVESKVIPSIGVPIAIMPFIAGNRT